MKNFINPEDRAIELLLSSFYAFLVGGFFVFSIGIIIPISFGLASYVMGMFFSILVIFLGVALFRKADYAAGELKKKSSILVFFFALAVGLITSSINRPDIDDSVYTPKAVFYTENSSSLVDNSITWVAGVPSEASSFVFQYYEVLQASLSWLFGVHFLTIYH
ncbi:MAG: hypothetical protein ACRER3_26255, partial [Pseudomonas fluorescens]